MKVMLIDRLASEPMTTRQTVEFIPDSALLLYGKPFFIPELPGPWTITYHLAFRISRLGKSIAQRFAHRYYDAVTIAAKPATPAADPVLIGAMDGGLALGQWIPCDGESPLDITIGDDPAITLTISDSGIDTAIANLSKLMTFKMGDIMVPVKLQKCHEIRIGDHILSSIGGQKSLDFNIK